MGKSFREILCDGTDKGKTTLLKAVVAEYLCMSLFLFFAIGTISSNCHAGDIAVVSGAGSKSLKGTVFGSCALAEARLLTIALSFGFSIFVLVYAAASFSGGHLNPAVSIGLAIGGRISVLRAFLYIIAQCLGACTGAALVKAVDPNGWHAAAGGINSLASGITPPAGWGLETVLTTTLVFTVFCATDAERGADTAHLPVLAPFAIGMDVFLCHMAALAWDGCSVNPARSFGASAVAGVWTNHWIFWVGPICGAVLAALLYQLVFRTPANKTVGDMEVGRLITALPVFSGRKGLQEAKDGTPDTVSSPHVAQRGLDHNDYQV